MKQIGGIWLGICLIISFISFGYMTYQWVGGVALLLTAIFSGIMIVALNYYSQEIKKSAEASVHRQYEEFQHH